MSYKSKRERRKSQQARPNQNRNKQPLQSIQLPGSDRAWEFVGATDEMVEAFKASFGVELAEYEFSARVGAAWSNRARAEWFPFSDVCSPYKKNRFGCFRFIEASARKGLIELSFINWVKEACDCDDCKVICRQVENQAA